MKRWADKNCPSRTFDLAVLHFFEQLSPGLIPELLHHDSNPIFVPFLDSRHIKKMADLFRRKSSTYQQCFLERLPKLMRHRYCMQKNQLPSGVARRTAQTRTSLNTHKFIICVYRSPFFLSYLAH